MFIFFTCEYRGTTERVTLKGKTILDKEYFKECLGIMEANMIGVKTVRNDIKVAQQMDETGGSRMGFREQPYWWNVQAEDLRNKCNEARRVLMREWSKKSQGRMEWAKERQFKLRKRKRESAEKA